MSTSSRIVKELEDSLAVEELALKISERSVLCQGIECEHQRVALLAALGLTNIVRAAIIGHHGSVNAGCGIELPRVRQQRLQLKLGKPCT